MKIDHINLTVENLEQSIEWYSNTFGFEMKEKGIGVRGQAWVIVGKDDSMIAMNEYKLLSAETNLQSEFHKINHFGIRISKEKAWEKKINEYQIKVYYGGVVQHPFSKSWYIKDPSGHEIEVSFSENKVLQFFGTN